MTPTAAPAIECRGVAKRYGTVVALDGLDLEVPAGSVFGFLGPNGAGKSTTLRILASLARANAGTARVAGVAVGDGAPNRAGLIGYLDQDPRFYGWMTPRDLLGLVGKLHPWRAPHFASGSTPRSPQLAWPMPPGAASAVSPAGCASDWGWRRRS